MHMLNKLTLEKQTTQEIIPLKNSNTIFI